MKRKTVLKNTGGRPKILTKALGNKICELIASGMTLRQVEKQAKMPCKAIILRWAASNEKNFKWFVDQYERALKIKWFGHVDELIDIADDGSNDWMEREAKDGEIYVVVNKEHIQRSRLRVDTRKWIASKELPKFSDKPTVKEIDPDDKLEPNNVTINFLPVPEKSE